MGKAQSSLRRLLLNYNVERRAEKVISREKPQVAPMAEKDAERVRLTEADSEIRAAVEAKDSNLDKFLMSVRVQSQGPAPAIGPPHPEKLPQTRSAFNVDSVIYDKHVYDPPKERIPEGKLALKEAIELMNEFARDPRSAMTSKVPSRLPRRSSSMLTHYFAPFIHQKELDTINVSDRWFWKNLEDELETGKLDIPKYEERSIAAGEKLKQFEKSWKAKKEMDPEKYDISKKYGDNYAPDAKKDRNS